MTEEESGGARVSSVITGFIDYTPEEQCLFHSFLEKIIASYELFGFTPLHLRPFERMSALQGEGETSKQIFEVFRKDTQKTTDLGLPFDHTVPLALWVAEHAGHWQHLSLPYKRYDTSLVYRGERPKTGRFRSFVQADVDIVGRKLSLSSDAECLLAVLHALRALGIGEFQMHLNHIGIVKSLLAHHEVDEKDQPPFLRAIDKLDKLSEKEVLEEISRTTALPSFKQKTLLELFTRPLVLTDPSLEQVYGQGAVQGIAEVKSLIDLLIQGGASPSEIVFSLSRVRGLDYYTGIVCETLLTGKESYGSIASGGRYSNLVSDFAKNLSDVEGVGMSIGLTRLIDVLVKTGLSVPKKQTLAHVLIGSRTEELTSRAASLARALRKQGIFVDLYSGPAKVKQILGHADAIGIKKVILVMDEMAFVVKEMQAKTQTEYKSIDEVVHNVIPFIKNNV